MCLAKGYTGHYAEDGETILCFDATGDLIFWIDADGIIGLPNSSSGTSPSNNPATQSSAGNDTDTGSSPAGSSSSSMVSPASSATTSATNKASDGNAPAITYTASGATITKNNGCVEVNGGEVVITCAGEYNFSGTYTGSDAQIRVYSPKSDSGVYLNLRGLALTNNADAPIYVQMASKVFVVAKSGTENTFTDASTRTKTHSYVNANGETKTDTTGACIYAKDDLTIKGEGTLTVKGNYNNGIHSSNDLRFRGETIVNVSAKNHGLKGKELVDIEKGNITINATSGDGIHSDMNVVLTGGNVKVNAGDDGIHADSALHLAGSTVNVEKAGEGMEAFYIFAEGGVTATYGTDDGWNAAGGSADGSTSTGGNQGGWGMGMGGMQSSSKGYIVITGGYHYISASGNDIDVLDANGTATQKGGVVIVEIPASSGGMGGGQRMLHQHGRRPHRHRQRVHHHGRGAARIREPDRGIPELREGLVHGGLGLRKRRRGVHPQGLGQHDRLRRLRNLRRGSEHERYAGAGIPQRAQVLLQINGK